MALLRDKKTKTLTDVQIMETAKENLKSGADLAALSVLYMLTLAVFILLCEYAIYWAASLLGIKHYSLFSIRLYRSSPAALVFLGARLVIYHIFFTIISYVTRRYYINLADKTPDIDRFLSKHMNRMFSPSVKCGLWLSLFKLMVSMPLAVGIYGVVHFYHLGKVGNISLIGLIYFMLSIGFTLVWTAILIHYFMSLSLVKYIIELNPRADFFEACDLSIKLMDGWHTRVLIFGVSMLPYIMSCVLLYPAFIVIPFVSECRTILAKEIMGHYWQDKIPAMAKRWEKRFS